MTVHTAFVFLQLSYNLHMMQLRTTRELDHNKKYAYSRFQYLVALERHLTFNCFYFYRLQLPAMGASIAPLWHGKFWVCYQIPNLQETN